LLPVCSADFYGVRRLDCSGPGYSATTAALEPSEKRNLSGQWCWWLPPHDRIGNANSDLERLERVLAHLFDCSIPSDVIPPGNALVRSRHEDHG
jgi:hypothetical protein